MLVTIMSCNDTQNSSANTRVASILSSPITVQENLSVPSNQALTIDMTPTQASTWQPDHFDSLSENRSAVPAVRTYSSNYTPYCNKAELNTLYTLTPAVGNTYCVYFDVPVDARTVFFVENQTSNRQVDLQLIQDIQANHVFTGIGYSAQSGTSDNISLFADAGHYYIQISASAADGQSVQFGVSAKNLFTLNQDMNYIQHTLDYNTDVDYFRIKSDHAKEMVLKFLTATNEFDPADWHLEIFDGVDSWMQVSASTEASFNVPADQYVYMRIYRDNTASVAGTGLTYRYALLTSIHHMTDMTAKPPVGSNVTRMPYGSTSPYFPTQFYDQLTFQTRVTDSAGEPVEGANVNFWMGVPPIILTLPSQGPVATAISDANGLAVATIQVDDCNADSVSAVYSTYINNGSTRVTQRTHYQHLQWSITVPDAAANSEVLKTPADWTANTTQEAAEICGSDIISTD
ncbi:hypothetical protein [Gynuella sp.]|uniref:hypothetical protein n=1 Tax=Gynuella sp. TaxID=2969146 RepID=UPI003D0D6784